MRAGSNSGMSEGGSAREPDGRVPAGADRMRIERSSIHGVGAFARTDISAGTRVVEYVGETIGKSESLRRCELNNQFIFHLDADRDLDGDVEWNPARWINHSCVPNCEAVLEGGGSGLLPCGISGRGRRSRSITATTLRIIGSIPVVAERRAASGTLWRRNYLKIFRGV